MRIYNVHYGMNGEEDEREDKVMKKSIETNLTILDGTSRARVIKAIRKFEKVRKAVVLSFFVASNNYFIMVEFNGRVVSEWAGKIDEFLEDITAVDFLDMM